ncbi:uncharacterized protein LOC129301727 [Prosopis cineraria]|uniref:uncharacterized protein LOC129301727 n=1 Tax=Prosopis cineraria TaxID=364024 RepID=UPI00240EFF4F|nr:uncharacterized protein LOC129301727 [Prosopis cineraria]
MPFVSTSKITDLSSPNHSASFFQTLPSSSHFQPLFLAYSRLPLFLLFCFRSPEDVGSVTQDRRTPCNAVSTEQLLGSHKEKFLIWLQNAPLWSPQAQLSLRDLCNSVGHRSLQSLVRLEPCLGVTNCLYNVNRRLIV